MAAEPIDVVAAPPGPTPINAQPQPPAMNESQVRAAVMQAEAAGQEVADVTAQTSGLDKIVSIVPPTAPQTQTPQDVPAKFKNPDGTVDVQKITDSTKQLDAGIEKKQLTIEEALAQYKEKERQFRSLPSDPAQVQRYVQEQAQAPQQPAPMPYQPPAQQPLPADQIQTRIMQEYQRDPIGTMADLTKVLIAQQQKPVLDFIEKVREQERDNMRRTHLSELAQEDQRVLHPGVYAEILKEMESEPAYSQMRNRNPYKAAWNEVKGRLRLGEVQTPAQPSRTATPILGGGTPPPVPSSAGQATPQNLLQAIGQMKTPDEQALVEAEIRRLMISNGM